MDFWEKLKRFFAGLFARRQPVPPVPPGLLPEPVECKVLVLVFNPTVPGAGGELLTKVLNWNDPQELMNGYIEDLRQCSYGYLNYQIVERHDLNYLPVKKDGFVYTSDAYVQHWKIKSGFHQPDQADYQLILQNFDILEGINSGRYDEVWLFGPPFSGFYESRMVGPGAFWCNAPPLEPPAPCNRRFIIMGFNYERGVGEMLESFGHRVESIMEHVYRRHQPERNLWQRFIRYDKAAPGMAEVGSVHFAPNSQRDYDWGNHTPVLSRCDSWYNFPNIDAGTARVVDCREWGNGDIREHHRWWLMHLPHFKGEYLGIACNWWQYVIDPNLVR